MLLLIQGAINLASYMLLADLVTTGLVPYHATL